MALATPQQAQAISTSLDCSCFYIALACCAEETLSKAPSRAFGLRGWVYPIRCCTGEVAVTHCAAIIVLMTLIVIYSASPDRFPILPRPINPSPSPLSIHCGSPFPVSHGSSSSQCEPSFGLWLWSACLGGRVSCLEVGWALGWRRGSVWGGWVSSCL